MAGFDEILQGIHMDTSVLEDEQSDMIISIDKKRNFIVPEGYDTVLGYAGDVHSQVITFILPLKHEQHSLYQCDRRVLKWKNLSSGAEGESELPVVSSTNSTWTTTWDVPPELMTAAGRIEIAISIYDIRDSVLVFAWNTAPFRGFTVAQGFGEIGSSSLECNFPAESDILIIDIENKNIVTPIGFKTQIATFGDIGTSKVHFLINRKVCGMDILEGAAAVKIHYSLGGTITQNTSESISKRSIIKKETGNTNENVLITWEVPPEITNNAGIYAGSFTIAVEIFELSDGVTTKRWTTLPYTNLSIAPSLLQTDIISFGTRDEMALEGIISKYFEETVIGQAVDEKMDAYMQNNFFVIKA